MYLKTVLFGYDGRKFSPFGGAGKGDYLAR
jgi:hypothetical protein